MGPHSERRSDSNSLIRLAGIAKRFGNTWANRDISLDIREGEIHALVGENGAGKSTLLELLFGHLQPDRGEIFLRGRRVVFRHPQDALRCGIGMVHQQLLIFPRLTTLENVIVGAEVARWSWLNRTEARSRVEALCRTFGFDLPLDRPISELPYAHHQQVEIVRMLYRGATLLLLDEPTSLLAPPEVAHLFEVLRNLQVQGHTIVFVSHRLEEVFSIAERVSVLVGGQLSGSWPVGATSIDQIARRIVSGGTVSAWRQSPDEHTAVVSPGTTAGMMVVSANGYSPTQIPPGTSFPDTLAGASPDSSKTPFLLIQDLSTAPSGYEAPLADLTLPAIGSGEILGVGAIVGNGLRSLAHALAGFAPVTAGRIRLQGRDITSIPPKQRRHLGLRWLPANPLEEALLPARPLWENILLGHQRHPDVQWAGFLRKRSMLARATELLDRYAVRYQELAQPVATLSGGNQQKLALAGVLCNQPRLVILEQPSRGLDLQAQHRLYQRLRSMSSAGVTFIVLSHELDDLLALCHCITILYRGRLMGVVPGAQARREQLGRWMLGLE
jgi:general nucleoside transport system ATP-binding protein